MTELIDIYTEDSKKIGTTSKKEYYFSKSKDIAWINCCTCFVVDDLKKQILFEKRGERFLDPGKLDLCSGHVQSGETPIQGMIRELKEELNIKESDSRNVNYLGKLKIDYTKLNDESNRKPLKCFVSVYALKVKNVNQIQIDNKEAIDLEWMNFKDTVDAIYNNNTRIPYDKDLVLDYKKIFKNLKDYIYPELNKLQEKEK